MAADPSTPDDRGRLATLLGLLGALIHSIAQTDPSAVEEAALRLGKARWYLAPVGWATATIVLLFEGTKLLVRNWRLIPVQALPAAWISITLYTLERHLFDGREVPLVRGPVAWMVGLIVAGITLACYWCNAVFAFTLLHPNEPRIRPAWQRARHHARFVNAWGLSVGCAYAAVALWVSRVGPGWYFIGLSAVLTVMIITFVAVPASLLGARRKEPPRQKLAGAALRGLLSAIAVTPGFLLNRLGLLMLGVPVLRVLGAVVFVLGAGLQAVATSSARAVKLGAQLGAGDPSVAGSTADLGP